MPTTNVLLNGGSVVATGGSRATRESAGRDVGVRPALRQYLERQELAASDATLIEELGLCQGRVRIDLATVSSVLHGYEIKSNLDRLSRLSSQAATYNRVLDHTQDPRALVELLWRDEALELLECHDAAAGVRSKPRPAVWDRVCEVLDLPQIRSAVRYRLRARAATVTSA